MALGGAMCEAVPVEHGRFAQLSLVNCPVPRSGDVPELEIVLVDRPDPPLAPGGRLP